MLELAAADSTIVTFAALTGTLKIDQPSTFSGKIVGFTGDGTLTGSDKIDLTGINFSTLQESYASGELTVTDGTHTAALTFQGSYAAASFAFADDGHGGTLVFDPPVTNPSPSAPASAVSIDATNDAFIFNADSPSSIAIGHEGPAATQDQHVSPSAFATINNEHKNIAFYEASHDALAIHHALVEQHHTHLL
jgi:hypothetical protein